MRTLHAPLIAGLVTSFALGACGGKPSEADCTKFADRVVELASKTLEPAAAEVAKGMLNDTKPEMIKECIERGTKAEIDCALAAESMEALDKCSGDKGADKAAEKK